MSASATGKRRREKGALTAIDYSIRLLVVRSASADEVRVSRISSSSESYYYDLEFSNRVKRNSALLSLASG